MPYVSAIGTANPAHILPQSQVREFARALYGGTLPNIDRLVQVYDNALIERRHFCVPLDWFAEHHTFREKNDLFIANALELSKRAIDVCLEGTDLSVADIDYLLFVTTTGVATPSIDARLIEDLPFRKNVKRLPIWGLGCAGGASALSRALDITTAYPKARVLAIVVELCGLTFMRDDMSKPALIATALFGDGAAAVLVEGDDVAKRRNGFPELVASATRTMPDSLDVMGWDVSGDGFGIVISRDIPTIVRTFMRESIDEFLRERDVALNDIRHLVTHPGGAKVLEAYQEALDSPREAFRHTWDVLRDYGNMSACSVLFVLQRFIDDIAARTRSSMGEQGEYGLLGALGPGFSSELVLLRWSGE